MSDGGVLVRTTRLLAICMGARNPLGLSLFWACFDLLAVGRACLSFAELFICVGSWLSELLISRAVSISCLYLKLCVCASCPFCELFALAVLFWKAFFRVQTPLRTLPSLVYTILSVRFCSVLFWSTHLWRHYGSSKRYLPYKNYWINVPCKLVHSLSSIYLLIQSNLCITNPLYFAFRNKAKGYFLNEFRT